MYTPLQRKVVNGLAWFFEPVGKENKKNLQRGGGREGGAAAGRAEAGEAENPRELPWQSE